MHTDGTNLFYILWDGGNFTPLYSKPLAGGTPKNQGTVFTGGPIYGVDATYVYYRGNFSLAMKVAK